MTSSAALGTPVVIDLQPMTRSDFILRSALMAAGAYGLTAVGPLVGEALAQGGGGDVDILNFALTLEHLEAAFYQRAVAQLQGADAELRALVRHLRDDEVAHVDALRTTVKKLGGTPVKASAVNFGGAFESTDAFLRTASMLEETGVSAYNGAATAIDNAEVLAAAGSIVQIEARHAALIHLARGSDPSPSAFDKPAEERAVLARVAPLLANGT